MWGLSAALALGAQVPTTARTARIFSRSGTPDLLRFISGLQEILAQKRHYPALANAIIQLLKPSVYTQRLVNIINLAGGCMGVRRLAEKRLRYKDLSAKFCRGTSRCDHVPCKFQVCSDKNVIVLCSQRGKVDHNDS